MAFRISNAENTTKPCSSFFRIEKNAIAGDVMIMTAEPLEPGWTKMDKIWYRVADNRDSARWVETKPASESDFLATFGPKQAMPNNEWIEIGDYIRSLPWRRRVAIWFARMRLKIKLLRLRNERR